MTPEHPDYPAMREEFLDIYAANLCRETRLFPGMAELLDGSKRAGCKWGIVTNKAERFTHPLLELLGSQRAAPASSAATPPAGPSPTPSRCSPRAERIGIAAATASTSATTGATSRPAAPPA